MADNQGVTYPKERRDPIPEVVRNQVYNHIVYQAGVVPMSGDFSKDDVYVVWFCYILGNYKALVSTVLPDGRYYEVTCDWSRGKVFIDTYVKTDNTEYDIMDPEDQK